MRRRTSLKGCATVLTFIVALNICFTMEAAGFPQEGMGTIRGKVEIPPQGKVPQRTRSTRYRTSAAATENQEAESPSDKSDVTNIVIYLEGKGLETAERTNRAPLLDQRETTFIPHVLPVVKGTAVRIVNRDKIYHNVFSLSSAKKFNIGRRPTGEEVPVEFDKPGVVQVFCDIHSNMSAFILILDNPLFVQPDADGSFEIKGVPPGQYTITAWHERLTTPQQQVTIRPGGTATVNFQF